MKKYFALLLFSFFIHSTCLQAANFDTSFKYSTIESDHFKIHYHQGLEEIARHIALIAEEEHPRLTEIFGWVPKDKTEIIIIDKVDKSNGFAMSLPRNLIVIYPVYPESGSMLSGHGDWFRLLFIHEYSHILSMDSSFGYSRIMRALFGKPMPSLAVVELSPLLFFFTSPPNNYLPKWWHEGIATWSETEFTPAGRGRSSYFDMIYRMAVSERAVPSIDQINGDVPDWPGGSMRYIFGLALQKYIIDQYGLDTVARLNRKHARRVPYFIDGAAEQLLDGKNYSQIYADMVKQMRYEQNRQIEKLRSEPFTETMTLNLSGQILTAPRYSPNGKYIVYYRRDPNHHHYLMLAKSDGTDERILTRVNTIEKAVSWSADGKKIYFSQAEVNRGFNLYQDLYQYDLAAARVSRLTDGLRLREPDISPDGRQLVAVMNSRGRQSIVILPADSDTVLTDTSALQVIDGKGLTTINSPRWSPDGKSIAYVAKSSEGSSHLYIYHIEENHHELLQAGYFEITDSGWTGDGQGVVYSSDKTGVFNIYMHHVDTGKNIQLTHLLGGAFQPDMRVDGGQLIFSGYNAKGFSLQTVNLEPGQWFRPTPVIIRHNWSSDYSTGPEVSIDKTAENREFKTTAYKALPGLMPTFWFPFARSDSQGDVFGIFSSGQDVLGYNSWFLEYAHGVDSGENYYNATYVNNYLYPTITLNSYRQSLRYSDPFIDGYEREKRLSLALEFPVNRFESNHFFTLGIDKSRNSFIDGNKSGNSLIFEGDKNSFFASYYFSNALRYPYSISNEEGYQFNITWRNYGGFAGGDLDAKEYLASFSSYLKLPWSEHHVFYLDIKAKRGHGDRAVSKIGGYTGFEQLPLRGYPGQYYLGKYAATATVEYRLPLRRFFSASGTSPLFYRQLHGTFFVDQGEVWNSGFPSGDEVKTSVGFEVAMDVVIGYQLPVTPLLGFAHGFDLNGESRVYFTIKTDI